MNLRARHRILAFLAYTALAVAATWPLAAAPRSMGLDNDDTYSHCWALHWVNRQMLHDPLRLYESNMYWPFTHSLAYGESLLAQSALSAPIFWAGGDGLLAHNVMLILTFPLAGLGAYLLAFDLTRSRPGAFLAGLAYGFSGYRWDHLVQIGTLSMQWLPFVVLFFLRSLKRPNLLNLSALGGFAVLQALSSGYYAVLLGVLLGVSLFWHARAILRRGLWRRLLVSLGLAGAVIIAHGLPYHAINRRESITRSAEDCYLYSARIASYVDPGRVMGAALPHMRWLRDRCATRHSLFSGAIVLMLSLLGALVGRGRRGFMSALVLTGFVLSLGPGIRLGTHDLPGAYDLLRLLPPVRLMRAPSRLGALAILGLSALSAFGLAGLTRRVPRRFRAGIVVPVVLLAALETYPVGIKRIIRPVSIPPTAGWLAKAPRGPVIELPWNLRHLTDPGRYLYWSTRHWQNTVNGFGAFVPKGSLELGMLGRRFPQPNVVAVYRGIGIRWVVIHVKRMSSRWRRYVEETPLPKGVRLAADFGDSRVYEIAPEGSSRIPRWLPDLWREMLAKRSPAAVKRDRAAAR
jgi:hypothetical protein